MIKNEDSLNIIFSQESKESPKSLRFKKYNYLLPQYIALFLNSEKLNPDLRNIILFNLSNLSFSDSYKEN
jgi:hypothetical protein